MPEKIGDFDDAGKATILDVVQLINHATGAEILSTDMLPYPDVNADGYVDQDDVRGLTDRVLERLPLESLPLTILRQASPPRVRVMWR